MFPISDSMPSRRFPFFTLLIIGFSYYEFFREIRDLDTQAFINTFALIPSSIIISNPTTWFPFVTAIFLHGGFLHILSNMWFLWVFGDNVEGYFGPPMYLILYFLSGIVGNITQYIMMPHSSIPLLGASGAIAGVLGAYYVLFPSSRIKSLVFIFFFVTIVDIPAAFMLGYWFVLQIISSSSSILNINQGGVAFFAHIGGFLAGVLFAKIFQNFASS